MKCIVRRFVVLPGVQGIPFDFTGMTLLQFGIDWLVHPVCTDQYVLRQPECDINGRRCATGGSVAIDIVHLREVEPIEIEPEQQEQVESEQLEPELV